MRNEKKSAHRMPKKKVNGLLSGWVVEVHQHHAKAPAFGSRTPKTLGLTSNRLCYGTYVEKWWRKCVVLLLFYFMCLLFAIEHPSVVK